MRAIERFLGASAVYTLSRISTGAISFLLLPILTRYLSPEDYGTLGIIGATLGVLSPLVGFNPFLFIITKYHKLGAEEIKKYVSNNLIIVCATVCIFVPIASLARGAINEYLGLPLWTFNLIILLAGLGCIFSILLSFFQIEERPVIYGFFQVSKSLMTISLALYLVVARGWGWEGPFLGDVMAALLFGGLACYIMIKHKYIILDFCQERILAFLRFSIPLLPHVIGLWVINAIDRYFVANMVGMAEAGVYTVAYSIAMIVGIVHDSLLKAWSPIFYKKINEADRLAEVKHKLVKYTYYYFLLSILMGLIFCIFAPPFMRIFVGEKFRGGSAYIFWIVMGYTFNGMYKTVAGYIYHVNLTYILAMITLLAAIINIVLNYILIRAYGAVGAAQATFIAFLLSYIITHLVSARLYPMPWLKLHKV